MDARAVSPTLPPARPEAGSAWVSADRAFMQASLGRVRLLLHRRILWLRTAWRHDPLAAHRGLVVSDARADRLLAGPDVAGEEAFHRTDPTARAVEERLADATSDVERRRKKALEAGAPPRLDELARRFGLTDFARDTLVLTLGPEWDPDLETLYAYAQNDATRRYATPNLALALLADAGARREVHRLELSPHAPLRRYRLLELVGRPGAGTGLGHRPLVAPERVQDFLRGAPTAPPPFVDPVPPVSLHRKLDALARRLGQRLTGGAGAPSLCLLGPRGSGRRAVAWRVCRELGLGLHALDVAAAAADPQALAREGPVLEREARLCGLAVYVDGDALEDLADAGIRAQLVAVLDRLEVPFLVGGVRRWPGRRPLALQALPRLRPADRRALWHAAFASEGLGVNGGVDRLVHQFEVGPSAIAETVRAARGMARIQEGEADVVGLAWQACRERSGPALDALAQRIEPVHGWDDIVLPGDTTNQLRELAAQVRLRGLVYGAWGFGEKLGRRRGISALFSGPSGTGKTMAAEVLAADMDLPLYRIDLSGVVSKYIGETEKNLRKVFDAAEDSGVVLFFDEADALFGKRSEVRDSHDRYANMEVNYLLQRMEDYVGLVILATNMKSHLDPAFLRRLRFLVDFPFPDPADRRRIWEKSFPDDAVLGELDLVALSRLSVAGGNIRNIAVNGAFLAADDGGRIEMRHLYHAARQEYAKIEKLVVEAEFGAHARRRRRS